MNPIRNAVLIASLVGISLVAVVYIVLTIAKPPAGTREPVAGGPALVELMDQGNGYGHDGDWRQAFECFRKVVAVPGQSDLTWCKATAAALAAGESNACEELCRQMLDLYAPRRDTGTAERCSKAPLSLPGIATDLSAKAAAMADFAAAGSQAGSWEKMAKARADYRRGRWAESLKCLEAAEGSSNPELAVQALCFGAMARQQLGDALGARQALEAANRWFKMMLRTGVLGGGTYWDNFALAVAVRAQAEQLVLGQSVSLPLDPADVAERRSKWQPVAEAVASAALFGQQNDWSQARDAYARALDNAAFDWDVSELKQEDFCLRVSSVFLLAGDVTRNRDLCLALAARPRERLPPVMEDRYAQLILANTNGLPQDVIQSGLALAGLAGQAPVEELNAWRWLTRGLAELREGRQQQALASFQFAQFPEDGALRARVLLYRAIANKGLGRPDEALKAAQQAEAEFVRAQGKTSWIRAGNYELTRREFVGVPAAPATPGTGP
jgi:tetratricopeptide (TPR) repeat protein